MKKIISSLSRGFTLTELVVVIAIFSLVSAISLFNQGKLNSSVLITNLAYEVALTIREAQTYGVGVRADTSGSSFEGGYGVSFSIGKPLELVLFADVDGDYTLNTDNPGLEEVSHMTIQNQRGNKVTALCMGQLGSSPCVDGGEYSLNELSIVFKRPNPEAIFRVVDKDGVISEDPTIVTGPAYIVLNTPSFDNCRVVVVEKTGQIRVDNSQSGLCQNQL